MAVKKIIKKKEEKNIDINSVLNDLSSYYVFYKSSNNGYPVMLTYTPHGQSNWYFRPALATTSHASFHGYTAEAAIEKAMKQRKVYAVNKADWEDLYKEF